MEGLFMSAEFLSAQEFLVKYPVFPTLWVPHCIMMSLVLRSTLGANWYNYSRQNPLSLYILGILYTFPGGILATILMAQPALSFLLNTPFMAAMSVSWYLVFYAPFDLLVKFVDSFRLRVPFGAMQDFLRIKLVYDGVSQVHKLHPTALLYPIIFAICKSSGFMFLKYAEYVLQNGFKKAFILPHHSTKTCVFASVVMTAQVLGYFPPYVSLESVFTVFVIFAVSMRLFTVVSDADPYDIVEIPVSMLVFGNTIDEAMEIQKNEASARSNYESKTVSKKKAKVNKKFATYDLLLFV